MERTMTALKMLQKLALSPGNKMYSTSAPTQILYEKKIGQIL
jgi:hypothetical protein